MKSVGFVLYAVRPYQHAPGGGVRVVHAAGYIGSTPDASTHAAA